MGIDGNRFKIVDQHNRLYKVTHHNTIRFLQNNGERDVFNDVLNTFSLRLYIRTYGT